MSVTNIVLAGVGGQGTLLVSTLLTKGLIEAGFDVKMSEIHGMAQRGGSVSTQVRFGREVFSPVIGTGEADILVAFERMEALRFLPILKKDGIVIVNSEMIPSAPITAGLASYPEHILDEVKKHVKTIVIPAGEIAAELGMPRVMNMVLFGVLTKILETTSIDWDTQIRETVKPNFLEINRKAFERGRSFQGESYEKFHRDF